MIIYVIFFIGLATVIYALILKYLDVKAKKWHTTFGEIISSKVRRSTGSENNSYIYKCDFTYIYKPKGFLKELKGDKLFRGVNVSSSRKNEHLNICEKLKVGTQVRVYYNPSNPKKSCLVVGKNYHLNFLIAVGLFFMFLGLGIFLIENNEMLRVIDSINIIE